MNISVILKDSPQCALARQKAHALLAKASELRKQIVNIKTAYGVEAIAGEHKIEPRPPRPEAWLPAHGPEAHCPDQPQAKR